MFIHIGGDVIIPKNELIAIINLNSAQSSPITREFLQLAKVDGMVKETKKDGKFKSCIITDKGIYLSTISSGTLTKRDREFKY
ncbi:MAG TPA: DUF370 domain-containing protein [Peptococcaceae bacterium]|nr:MAG: hypothetical protein XD50_0340 [Clostridia bacterium 41_269]HBT19787.1 DUF370 domain-containing protein [Peptococcaceae bacterium]